MSEQNRRRVIYPVDGYRDCADLRTHLARLFLSDSVSKLIDVIKFNDAVFLPGFGPNILQVAQRAMPSEVGIFLDLKLADVSATNRNILRHFSDYDIRMLTIRSQVSEASFREIRALFPSTKIAVVCLPTDISEVECQRRYEYTPTDYITLELRGLCDMIDAGMVNAVVCSPREVAELRRVSGQNLEFVVPGIRDEWMCEDHQERIMGAYKALQAGADWLVIGSQLSKGNPEGGISPSDSQLMTFEEIDRFFTEREVRHG